MSDTITLPPRPVRNAVDMRRLDPLRRPDWRFRRVLEMVEHEPKPLRCTASDDGDIREMREFMLYWGGHRRRLSPEALRAKFPTIYEPFKVYVDASSDSLLFLECCLLAGLTDEAIATRMGITPDSVSWYERMRFNVRDHLSCHDAIEITVLDWGRKYLTDSTRRLKSLAYSYGPDALDFIYGKIFWDMAPPTPDADLSTALYTADLLVKEFVASMDKYSVAQLLELMRQIRADQHAEQASAATMESLAAAAQQVTKKPEIELPEQEAPAQDAESEGDRVVA